MRSKFAVLCSVGLALALAQTALTNDAIIKMVKAGLGDDVVISTVKVQPANYSTDPDGLIALKGAGVSDKVIAAMVDRMAANGGAAGAAPPATSSGARPVNEVGVYFRKSDAWADLNPEVVNFKTGGVLKSIGTAGIVKGDINGHVNGEHSKTQLKTGGYSGIHARGRCYYGVSTASPARTEGLARVSHCNRRSYARIGRRDTRPYDVRKQENCSADLRNPIAQPQFG